MISESLTFVGTNNATVSRQQAYTGKLNRRNNLARQVSAACTHVLQVKFNAQRTAIACFQHLHAKFPGNKLTGKFYKLPEHCPRSRTVAVWPGKRTVTP